MTAGDRSLHLASASPRRCAILDSLGLVFTSGGVGIDETALPGETAAALAMRLAAAKATAAAGERGHDVIVLGADTVVALENEMFGKPGDAAQAVDMLLRLAGREHEVLTGVAVIRAGRLHTALSHSRVRFRDIGPAEAQRYWQSGEPQDKAGGYAIQGLGGVFVASLEGSYSGVVGLPVFETADLLSRAGLDVLRINRIDKL